MAIRISQLPFKDQLKFGLLSKVDQVDILNCKTPAEASAMLENKKETVHLNMGTYEPKLQVSGSSVKYRTKNLFTEIFDEKDVQDFMMLVEMSSSLEDEVILGELKRKMTVMSKKGKQPIQCLVYATKNNEKSFYNNEKKVAILAQAIADAVNGNQEYILSMNHMLVNWNMWKYQIILLISACTHIRQNEKLDEVIRDLYVDYDDDKVRFTVMKRLLYGSNTENYQSAFSMLKKSDFIGSDTDRKYFNAVKKKVENAPEEERRKLYEAFRGIQGFNGVKRKRLERLFIEKEDNGIAKKINESTPEQKDFILKEVHSKIYGSQKDYREISLQSKDIKLYRLEIQDMFMKKLGNTSVSLEDIKIYGLAIGNLDSNGSAIPFLKKQMLICLNESKKLMYAYVLAIISDVHINMFIDMVLKYDGDSVHSILNSVRNLNRTGKNQIVRKYLYENCIKIKDKYGMVSNELKICLRNIGEFIQVGHTVAIYDVKFDQLLFDFLGYDKITETFEKTKCTARNTSLVLQILESVMDKNNYERRYMKFMWNLFVEFKNTNMDLSNRIDNVVSRLTGQGIPSMQEGNLHG